MKTLLISTAVAATALIGASAASANISWPSYGLDSQPGVIITFNANGSVNSSLTGQGPYDGIEDTYIGLVNNSSNSITSLNLSSGQCIGCFDGDGLAAYGAPTPYDPNGYGGPLGYFTNNTGYSLTVNFVGGVAPGSSTYFSLEEPVVLSELGVPEPTTWALMLIGFAGIGYAARRRTAVAA